jgi:hypothetical protein
MPIHDAYARRTPFEITLPTPDFAGERFPAVLEEADTQGFPGHLTDPSAFALLGEVGAILREIRDADDPPGLIDQYGLLLFQAFGFWRAGHPLYLVSEAAARDAVTKVEPGLDRLPASGTVYLQLPQHLFWVGAEPETPPESLDGFFITWNGGLLTVLAVAGVRPDRAGLSTLPIPSVPVEDLTSMATETMREEGSDFSSTMPGGDLDGLYGVESAGELLKLVARLLPRLLDASDAEVETAPRGSAPEGSNLPFRRISGS